MERKTPEQEIQERIDGLIAKGWRREEARKNMSKIMQEVAESQWPQKTGYLRRYLNEGELLGITGSPRGFQWLKATPLKHIEGYNATLTVFGLGQFLPKVLDAIVRKQIPETTPAALIRRLETMEKACAKHYGRANSRTMLGAWVRERPELLVKPPKDFAVFAELRAKNTPARRIAGKGTVKPKPTFKPRRLRP
jgi:hypothetical protein